MNNTISILLIYFLYFDPFNLTNTIQSINNYILKLRLNNVPMNLHLLYLSIELLYN